MKEILARAEIIYNKAWQRYLKSGNTESFDCAKEGMKAAIKVMQQKNTK